MKARINYKSKKVIAISAIAVILVALAIVGVVAFIKGNQDVTAALPEDEVVRTEEEINNNEASNTDSDEQNTIGSTENNENTTTNGTTTGTTSTNTANTSNTETTGSSSTGTTTSTTSTEVPNQEYIQETVIQGEEVLVEEATQVGWTPLNLSAIPTTADINIYKSTLETSKVAYINSQDSTVTLAQKGDIITYEITVANVNGIDATNINVYDNIPEGTELVENSISNEGINDNGKISWKIDIKVGEKITLSFKAKVIADTVSLISNTAKVDGKDTNTTNTPIIESNKKVEVKTLENDEVVYKAVETAKVGETLRYTITLNNTSDYDGTTNVSDAIPEGTTLVENSITENGVEDNGTITWKNVKVEASTEKTLSFEVTVNKDTTESVKNIAVVGEKDTNETETKVANITTVKTSKGSAETLHELDTITYTLTVSNSGNGKGSVVIKDTIPTGTTLVGTIKANNEEYTETELVTGIEIQLEPGETKTIEFTVSINPFEEEQIHIINNTATQDDEEIPGTDDTVIKEYVMIKVSKKFEDKNNIDLLRPEKVTVGLYVNGNSAPEQTVELKSFNKWSYTFVKLNKYDLTTKQEISYDVKEISTDANYTPSYTSTVEGNTITFSITNTLKYENVLTSKTAQKVWEDGENKVNARPASVAFKLYADGIETARKEVVVESNNWKVTFENLQKYKADGTEIVYTVQEETVPEHYTAQANGLTVTNTIDYTTFETEVSINKVWVDPASVTEHKAITIDLYQNDGATPYTSVTLQNGETSHKFTNLPKYDSNGDEYKYTAKEQAVDGYTTTYSNGSYTITNTINQDSTVSISGTKTWVDPEGTTHPTITINLLQNGVEYKETTIVNGNDSYEFSNLPKYKTDENGNYILVDGKVQLNVYTVTEDAVNGYTTSKVGNDFTNTINQETLNISGTKTWVDPQGTAHEDITINLLRDGTEIKEVVLKNGETSYTFSDLDKYAPDGHIYEYTLTEDAVDGYTTSKVGNDFTNTINQETLNISGTKTWIDPQGTVHDDITINLLRDGTEIKEVVLKNGELNYSFTDLDKYAPDGHVYEYTLTEDAVDGYATTYDGYNIKNTIDQETLNISGTKTWVDPQGTVHEDITINLLRDGTEIKEVVLKNGETSYNFDNLDKYAPDGHVYEYTLTEDAVDGYTTSKVGNDFINTIEQDNNVSLSGIKTWIDPQGTVHEEITINLLRDGTEIKEVVLKNGELNYSFTELDKYAPDGHVYEYTLTEDAVNGYTTSKVGNNFTNTINQEKLNISGTKTWVDPQGTAHEDITINLLRDGTEIKEVVLKNGETSYNFDDLDKYAPDGHIYEYTLTEDAVDGYTTSKVGNDFTNTINQETLNISGTKTWVDPQGTVHEDITINLLRDGTEIKEVVLKNGELNYSFTDLDKYAPDGHVYEYTLTEDAVDGYTTSKAGNNFTNTINQETLNISGTKTWVDPQGTAHEDITINLLRDGTEIKEVVLKNGETSYNFDDLDKYAPDGHIYTYTVTEDAVDGYTTSKVGNDFTNTINQETLNISGTKTWVDPQGTVHEDITINLLRDGTEYKEVVLKNGETSYNFDDLDKYAPDGHMYEYVVTEDAVDGYTTSKVGNDFTNTINQEKLTVEGTKTWVDPQGTAHKDITINLLRDGTEIKQVVLKNGETSYNFDDLEKYAPDGHIYEYTVTEDAVDGYTTTISGNNITNTINQVKIVVSGRKIWVDPQGTTHEDITINLLRDGTEIKEVVLKNGETSYAFDDLDKYAPDGHMYEYVVTEDAVDGYTTTISGNNITNTINQVKFDISGTKTWVDPQGTIHEDITINLLRDGTEIKEVVLKNGETSYTFPDLEKYAPDGHIYEYTVTEDAVDGYTTTISGNNITNTINQVTFDISGTKTWVEDTQKTHPTITINLLKDGTEIKEVSVPNGTTTYTFSDLEKYAPDGHEYVYTITEDAVKNYTTTYDGYNVTNTFAQDITGTVTVTTTTSSTTQVSSPIDVVFVLDVSGSMKGTRATNMVSAVNKAMGTIMSKNSESRVGIATFSEGGSTLLPLASYTAKTNGNYLTISGNTITTNVTSLTKQKVVDVDGGTYTQAGIKQGAELLTSTTSTTYTTTINEEEVTLTRTPVMILLSDGDPTYYSTNYTSLGNRQGNGGDTTEYEAYYTIRTAAYYKEQITNHYYAGTSDNAKFYTIGFGMDESDLLANTILNPTATNVNKCNTEGGRYRRNVKGRLYDLITENNVSAGAYSYSDKLYFSALSDSALEDIFTQIINQNSTSTTSRDITLEESDARRVDLENIDTTKAFSLTINGTTYSTLTSAINAGYVKGNATDGYYVDLSNVSKQSTISIVYNK